MRLIGYTRVSGATQAVDGLGLDVQEADIRSYAKKHGHRLIGIETDAGLSGSLEAADRPGLSAALLAVDDGRADGIIAARLDRIARSLMVQEAVLAHAWRAKGKVLTADVGEHLVDDPDDPMRTLIRQVLGAVAELDRKLVTKRLRDGRAAKAALGRHASGPYAYGLHGVGRGRERDAGPEPAEQATVARIMALRASGASYRAICQTLTEEGQQPRRAASWQPMVIRAIVQRNTAAA